MKPGLLTPSAAYKPFRYPWAFDMWKKQQQVHWMPEEIPLGEDCKDWATKLNDSERNLLTQIFRFFTQSDIEVQDNYLERYSRVFKPTEIKMMMSAFANMETVHIAAYALLLETIGMPESEFGAFMDYQAMRDKHDYMGTFGVDTEADVCRTLAMFGGFTEGLQLFASFAMLMNFPRFNKMKGMGQIVSWSVRDESLHCEGIIKLYHTFNRETKAVTKSVADDIIDCCKTVVTMEDKFIDLAFEQGPVQGMTPEDIKAYIRYIADWRLRQLELPEIYGGVKENPLPWLQVLLSGVEHANFFEARATEYSKAATKGQWTGEEGVWGAFDQLLKKRSEATKGNIIA
jgi:ribonucleoside-diphosphate reductase beta chain